MDNFMDKLARRFNSGEIMRANAAAEAREMKRAKEQAAEYERMMQEMRRLNLKNVEVTEQVQQLIQAGIEQFEEYGNEAGQLKILEEQNKQICEVLSIMKDELQKSFESTNQEHQKTYVQELDKLKEMLGDKLSGGDMAETVRNAQSETVEQIKEFQGELTESIKTVQAENENSIKAAKTEITDIIKTAQNETANSIKTAQTEITDRIKASHNETAEGIKAAQNKIADSINAVRNELTDSIKTAQSETLDGIKTAQTETIGHMENLHKLHNDTSNVLQNAQKEIAGVIHTMQSDTEGNQKELLGKFDSLQAALQTLQEKLNPENGEERQLLEEIKASVASIQPVVTGLQDYVHRENVKVYRNVQAVILDVASQKTRDLGDRIDALERKVGAVKGVTPLVIITMILALVSTVVQVLEVLGVF